jgi:hypothetical protein
VNLEKSEPKLLLNFGELRFKLGGLLEFAGRICEFSLLGSFFSLCEVVLSHRVLVCALHPDEAEQQGSDGPRT